MHRPIQLAVYRQIRSAVRKLLRKLLVDLNSQSGLFTGMHPAILERVAVRKNVVGLSGVPHILLDTEVMHAEIEVERGGHAYGTQVRCAVAAGAHLIEFRQTGDLAQVGDSSGMDDRCPDVVNELLLDQLLA